MYNFMFQFKVKKKSSSDYINNMNSIWNSLPKVISNLKIPEITCMKFHAVKSKLMAD